MNYFMPMCSDCGKQITRGMVAEFIARSTYYGYGITPEDWKHGEPAPRADGALPERCRVSDLFVLRYDSAIRRFLSMGES